MKIDALSEERDIHCRLTNMLMRGEESLHACRLMVQPRSCFSRDPIRNCVFPFRGFLTFAVILALVSEVELSKPGLVKA